MIIPMKKYSFLIHHRDFHTFLTELQDLGVLDVVDRGAEPDSETLDRIQLSEQYGKVITFLKSKINNKTSAGTDLTAKEILDKILHLQAESEMLKQKIAGLDKMIKILKPWGDFSNELLRKLGDEGFDIRFYVVSDKKFKDSWQTEYNLEVISRTEGNVYFVVVLRKGETIEIDAEEVKPPERSAAEVQQEKKDIEKRLREIEVYYAENAGAFVPVLEKEKIKLDNGISFVNVVNNAESEAEDKLMILEGWVPEHKIKEIESFLESKGIFYLTSAPEKKDKVPVMLKNGNFSRLFEPIGNLYSLPQYKELDLTPFFAPFFMLFFGFCLGDAGYGLLFVILSTVFKRKVDAEYKPVLTLLQWLGSSTVIFGILSGTFFGMNLIEMIDNGKLTWMQSLRKYMLDPEKMFYFALLLGAIQIIYGMIVKVINITKQNGIRYAFSTIGWILLIVGSIVLYLLKGHIGETTGKILGYIIYSVSGVLIIFLNNPEKNIFVNMGSGIWDVYSIATGVMGDLLSYIRLFALGVSSAILGYVFNDLAMQMSGDIPVLSQIIFVIILIIGHGLNIFMASLGAFVHPMRLTFVEFYKNAGFAGGGKPYRPFSKKEAG